jgi:5-(carboxyamino)imidazole ribonucleotide synthase
MLPPNPRPSPHGRLPRVGIIGGGQLAFLLCQAARKLGLPTVVLASSDDEPATRTADQALVGDMRDFGLAKQFISSVDIATFDKEAVPPELLDQLEAAENSNLIQVRPAADALRLLQNKADQKQWLVRNGLPTLPLLVLNGDERHFSDQVKEFGFPLVQKAQTGGYDGKGVQVIRSAAEMDKVWRIPCVLEPFLAEMMEIAVIVARSPGGQTRCYAPVHMRFEEGLNVLSTVTAPAELPGGLASEARAIANRMVHALGGIGVFCVEMFLTPDRQLLINEVSPRVHNAGHHTLEACATSQFEQHLRAITGMPLGPVASTGAAAMRNLLYTPELESLLGLGPGLLPQRHEGVYAWWYGKPEGRPWRKVGHVTAVADDLRSAEERLNVAVADLKGNRASAA